MTGCDGYLRHPALVAAHGFGTRAAAEPARLLRPRQVHGKRVAVVESTIIRSLGEADAVVSTAAGETIGVVTADCVPVLVAQRGAVVAIHAGWRGLAKGVIGAAIAALDQNAGSAPERVAVVGPHICPRHYEIDGPVLEALAPRFGGALELTLAATRPGHWCLDLGALTHDALRRAGLGPHQIFSLSGLCTYGDPNRFVSWRRDGPGGERLFHWIALPSAGDVEGLARGE